MPRGRFVSMGKKYKDNYFNGGFIAYEGVSSDGKEYDSITVDRDNSTVTVSYSDGAEYSVSADIITDGNVSEIINPAGSWRKRAGSAAAEVPAKDSFLAMLLAAGGSSHPDVLEYEDGGFTPPASVVPEQGETFDSITETWSGAEPYSRVWGVGIIDKGLSTEIVNRLIYPDGSEISLINFSGESGIG